MKRLTLIITCYFIIFFLLSCKEDHLSIPDNINAKSEIQLKRLYKINEIQDGYIVSGVMDSKFTIIKLDANFNIVWTRNNFEWGNMYAEDGWGGAFYSVNDANIIEQDNKNLACFCSIMHGGDVGFSSTKVVILAPSGNEIRSTNLESYHLINATTTSDSGYLLFGNSLVKLDSALSKISDNKDLNYLNIGANLTPTVDKCIAVSGRRDNQQLYLQKIDKNGSLLWENKCLNKKTINDLGCDIRQMSNEDFVIIGQTISPKRLLNMDCFIIRTNNVGDTIWTKKFGSDLDDLLEKFIYASDNDFIIREIISSQGNVNRRAYLTRISEKGEMMKSKEINLSDEYIYTSSGYFIKAEIKEDNIISLTKVPFDTILDE